MPGKNDALAALRATRVECALRPVAGERFSMPCTNAAPVDMILYRPQNTSGPLPVLFNMHGGAWIGGDAVYMDSFCQQLAREIPAFVVNVNYTKADVQPFPYMVDEVCDTVRYFAAHGQEYGIDPLRFAVGGHSAGAHIAACAALRLQDEIALAAQMLVYPAVDMQGVGQGTLSQIMTMMFPQGVPGEASPLLAGDVVLAHVAPAVFVLCGIDELRVQGVAYAKRLIDQAVTVHVKEYPKALHGFLEVCRPDYPAGDARQTPEQAEYARQCEVFLIKTLQGMLG